MQESNPPAGPVSPAGGTPIYRPGNTLETRWVGFIRQAAGGDESGLSALYDQTNQIVYSVVLRILGDRRDAEEVTLDVYTQVWRLASAFDSMRGSVVAWLVMLARSRALDRVRSKGVRERKTAHGEKLPDVPAKSPSPEEEIHLTQQRRLVRAAMEMLSPEQREAIELAYFSELSHSELADQLGYPLGTIKTRIRLGMMKLREILGESRGVGAAAGETAR